MNWFYYFSPWFLQTFIWPGTRPYLWFYIRLEVKGLVNLDGLSTEKGLIFASNHTSELDPVILPASLPYLSRFMPIFYTSRERAFYENAGWRKYFYGGFLFKIWGSHPVLAGLKDYEKSLQTHIEIVKHGKSVMIFPEGGIPKMIDSTDGSGKVLENKPARGGMVYLAEKTGAPIVPVAISGAYRITFGDLFSRKRTVTIEFGKPVYISGEGKHDYTKEAQTILDSIKVVAENNKKTRSRESEL